MSNVLDLLRAPAFGVVLMILLLAGVIFVAAVAALVGQMSLLLRLKPWAGAERKATLPQTPETRSSADRESPARPPDGRQGSPQVVAIEPNDPDVIDALWWQER